MSRTYCLLIAWLVATYSGAPKGAMDCSHEWSAAKLVGRRNGLLAPERAREAMCWKKSSTGAPHFLDPCRGRFIYSSNSTNFATLHSWLQTSAPLGRSVAP
jgi:hypothetical protein